MGLFSAWMPLGKICASKFMKLFPMQQRLIESRKEDNVAQEDEHLRAYREIKEDNVAQEDEHLRAYREINEGYDRLS